MADIKELSYRTFSECVDSCRLDLRSFNQTGDIDEADLIKVAQKINFELGLRIYMPKETVIEICHKRAKLPADFHQMQLALVCHHYKHLSTAPWNGNVWLEQITSQTSGTTCDICETVHTGTCPILVDNPYIEGRTRSICNDNIHIKVLRYCQNSIYCYNEFERLYIKPAREATSFCINTQFRDCPNVAQIHGNFLETSIEHGQVYISYLGSLEDEDGNLLVLDHPLINYYYEYEMQYQVLRSCYVNGDADLERRLKLVKEERDEYKQRAISIANMPSYREMLRTAEVTRETLNKRYVNPFIHMGYYGFTNAGLNRHGRGY